MATESVADVTAHLASWCKRAGTDLALVEFDSELARERVVADLRARLTPIDIPFHELALSADGGPAEVVRELISELSSFEAGVVSISGFGQTFPLSGSHEGMLAAFNFQRERLTEPPVRQIWWLPSRVAETFLHGAPDLYSWFTSRLHLTEVIAPWPAARPPIESWIAEGSDATPTSLEDARQRAAELARRFERALKDTEKPVTELALELMVPAVRALEEAGAVREAHELERDLRQKAREKKRPLPPRVQTSDSRAGRQRLAAGPIWNESAALGLTLPISGERGIGKTQIAEEKVLGSEHPDVAQRLNDLAISRCAQGNYASAASLYERALGIREKALGPEHPRVAVSLNDLANLHYAQGNYASAAPLYERALGIREKTLGPEHPRVATSLNDLANLHYAQGNYASAAPLYERSLRIREKVLGAEHPHVAISLNNLGLLHFTQGDYASALQLYRRSLTIFEQALGPAHPQVVEVLENYARLLEKTGQVEQAAELQAGAEAIRASRSGQAWGQDRE